VIGHIASDALWLDLRCLEAPDVPAFTAQLPALADALARA
jgi:L-seryl-tRNA(Ser) seleniumtransferase